MRANGQIIAEVTAVETLPIEAPAATCRRFTDRWRTHPSEETSDTARSLVAAASEQVAAMVDDRAGRSSIHARRSADRIESRARKQLTANNVYGIGAGGELNLNMPVQLGDSTACRLRDTTKDPDLVTATAQLKRLSLADRTGSLDIALDTADTIRPRNSMEKMLAHQLAAVHQSAMTMIETAMKWQGKADPDLIAYGGARGAHPQVANTEAARAYNVAARLMSAYNEGMLTLARFRKGGKQDVRVTHIHQHVQVAPGGQAIVAGNKVRGGKGGRGMPRGRGAK